LPIRLARSDPYVVRPSGKTAVDVEGLVRANRRPGRSRFAAVKPWVDIDAIVTDAERAKSVALRGEILLLC
jgi:hypothetical protein